MNIHCCSFASKSFSRTQEIQKKYFQEVGFYDDNIHLYNPNKLNKIFYENQPSASEMNKFGWFTFKPFFLVSILNKLENGDALFYLDVNDKPLRGIKSYINQSLIKNEHIDIFASSTNYPNFKFLSEFHKSNLSLEIIISSIFNFQPEAGALLIRNSPRSRSILWIWYNLTLIQAYELDKYNERKSRHDQETLYILSRIYKFIKFESWFLNKLTGKGMRNYIEFESLRQ